MQPPSTARSRYVETLTFGRVERVPLLPGAPRESTLAAWHTQGLPTDTDYLDALADILEVPRDAFDATVVAPVSFRMMPTFVEEVLAHRDGHYIVRDWMGAITEISDRYDYTYIRSAKDFVTRKWHCFPVQSPSDWEAMQTRYVSADPARYPDEPTCRELEGSGLAVHLMVNGPFWQLREWVGMENLCLLMADDPAFVLEMAEFWQAFVSETLQRALRRLRVDAVTVSEDMAYKAHSMISPRMARRFLLPSYLGWGDLLRRHAVPVYDLDSDGYIAELIPVWIEGGLNCCNPVEVAAGNDLVSYRRTFGRAMAYHGGIDKRSIAAGGPAMRAELDRVLLPLLQDGGGFIPSCDHGVPPDISWPAFVDYARELASRLDWI
jgi:uroporphyrinogen decarboxylase